MEHAFDQLAAAVRLFLILTGLQLVGPPLIVLAGRWWFPRVNSSVLGAAIGTILGLLNGVLCDGCYFVGRVARSRILSTSSRASV